ncbi:RNA polymerase II subunit A C-terminal domain phosphatase [Arapaima gigas]
MEEPADSPGPSAPVTEVRCSAARPLRLLEWKVKPGSLVNVDSVLALCAPVSADRNPGAGLEMLPCRQPERRVKSDRAGVVRELCCQPGQVVTPGGVLVRLEECSHPIVMKGLCAECGQDLTQLQSKNGKQQAPISTATVSMVHSVPELMVSSEQAEQLGREDQQRLHRNRKLVLMVDLDQTLIHTTEQHCQHMSNKGIFHFQLGRGEPMLHTRLRPHCKDFLEKIAKLYELHVFTFGSRLYAHTIAGFLDPEKKLFSHRILSRDECIDPFSKTGNLRNLFPCGDSMVCIIDDREDVWKFAPNLITVKKYTYFQGTGDINAPPGSKEAQMTKKVNHMSKPSESPESTVLPITPEEQSNGLHRRGKERPAGRGVTEHEEQGFTASGGADPDSPAEAGERTHPPGEGAEGLPPRADPLQKSSAQSATEVEDDGAAEETVDTPTRGTASSDRAINDLEFDLSSDSESDMASANPSSSDSETEGKRTWGKRQEAVGLELESGVEPVEGVDLPPREEQVEGEKHPGEDGASEQEGLRELDNGCSDKKEAETESQNSEQSGVTMGEESLDQSIEEEEEDEGEEPDLDQDDHLIYLEEVLTRIHSEYYARYEAFLKKENSEMPDIRKIVPELKSRSLAGTTIVFSGLYPTNYSMERTREFYHANALGAKIHKNLVLNPKDPDCTTHLIAARVGTEKVRQAQGCRHLHVVNPDWLWACLERWEHVEERLFPLKEDYAKAQRSSSPATFPDLQGPSYSDVFHPVPVQPKPPAVPEVRTYDPITGKLIRRGPQGSRQPSYPQPPTQGGQTSFRAVQQPPQQDRVPSNQDEEQPGPSRRKRQPSMSETMPLYTLCKEDLESMDKEVDDILGEESDNESEGGRNEKMEDDRVEEEEEERPAVSRQNPEGSHLKALETDVWEKAKAASQEEAGLTGSAPRGHKRKLEDIKDDDNEDSGNDGSRDAASDSSRESNEDEEGSSSEADEMAAALEAELNDFM